MIDISGLPIEEVLNEKGFIAAHPIGFSMRPFLRAHDTVILFKIGEKIEPWDCVLFKREDGVLVLHRVIKVSDKTILTRGDFEINFDAPVKRENVLAVMTEYYRGEEHVSVSDPEYVKKTKRWNGKGRKFRLFFYRKWVRLCHLMKRAFEKIFKGK